MSVRMKNSGVEWIGMVPEDWAVGRFKHAGRFQTGMDHKHLAVGDVPVYGSSDTAFAYVDTVMSTGPAIAIGRKGTVDKPFLLNGDFWAVDTCMFNCVASRSYEIKYCFYVASILPWIDYSTKTALPSLTQTQVDNVPLPRPSVKEQQRIASYLDRATARIDALVDKKTQFIELLREKRHALITHAVTKGLDARAPMKDSGIAWLGEVPAHWPTRRLAMVFHEVVRAGSPDLPVLSISIHDGISDDELTESERNRKVTLIEDKSKYKRVAPGDLAYNMMRAWQGAFGAVNVTGQVSPAYVVAEPKMPINTTYVELLLRTSMAIEEMRRFSRGIADFRSRLYWEHFRDIRICLPPIEEQTEIVSNVTGKTTRIDILMAKTERSIDLLREHRTALITAAVTGKSDLRTAA